MKVQLIGHDEKYAVEQSLLTLFPDERPIYGEIEAADACYARVTLRETADEVAALTELGQNQKTAQAEYRYPLSGTDYEREGQRRHAIGISFYRAAKTLLGISPAWGSLTGVRPAKVAAQYLRSGGEQAAYAALTDVFDVTEKRARLAVEAAQAGIRAADALKPNEVSLYVGIPFCPTRCAYCSFVAQSVERSFALVEPYLAALLDEVDHAGEMIRDTGLRIKSFYMGGGTPTTLTAEQMDRLLTRLEEKLGVSPAMETTVEAGRPDTVTPEKLAVLKRHGIGRVSINPQSMDDRVLAAIGRRHSADDILRAMDEVRAAGFDHVNMDLIAGLPEDTPEQFAKSLDTVLSLGADNVTVHTLSLKKGSRIMLEGRCIPGADEVAAMLDYADPTLRAAGFAPYYLYRQKYMSGSFENVGWCRPGSECLYNIYIMEELHGILSLGAGGSTKMVRGGDIRRVFNAKYPREYIDRAEKRAQNLAAFADFYREV